MDVVLDRTVVPGYSRLGYLVRRHGWSAGDPPANGLLGRVAIVTGAGSGLGKATTLGLARRGVGVHMLVRDTAKGARAREEILADVPGAELEVSRCDVSDLSSVREFAGWFAARRDSLDVLVHNAGVMPRERSETVDGNETAFATHVLGPFLLTDLLRPRLRAATAARVVFVSSGGMYTQALRADDPQFEQGTYRGITAYARTKRMQVVLAGLWARELCDTDSVVHSMHPGWAATPGVRNSLPGFHRLTAPVLRTPEEGADTIVWLASADEPTSSTGRFWHDRVARPAHYVPWTRESERDRERLWSLCRELTT